MQFKLIVADSPKELKVHDTKRYKVELHTFYITPLNNISDFSIEGGGLRNKTKLISTRVTFTYIKHSKGEPEVFPNFCCN